MSRLSRLLRKAAPVAAIAAPILGGPTNPFGLAATTIAAFGAPRGSAPAAPEASFSPVASMASVAGRGMVATASRAALSGMVGLVRGLTGKIRGVVLGSGKFINRKKAVALAKRVGLEAAAVALGISAVEMSEMILDESGAGRRRKGITARNIATTKRVICQVQKIHGQLGLRRGGIPRARSCA